MNKSPRLRVRAGVGPAPGGEVPLGRMTRFGYVAVRPGCSCGFCRTVRAGAAEIEIRSLDENRRRGGTQPPAPRKRAIV